MQIIELICKQTNPAGDLVFIFLPDDSEEKVARVLALHEEDFGPHVQSDYEFRVQELDVEGGK